MSAGSTKFTVSRIAALSLVSLWLAGCTNTNNPPAPVSSAGGAASSSTNSGMLITPPPSGVKSAPQAQSIQPMQTQTIQPQPAPRGTTLVSPVTMAIPAARAVSAMLATTASRVAISSPSSRIKPQER